MTDRTDALRQHIARQEDHNCFVETRQFVRMHSHLREAKLVHPIIGAFFEVYNYFGYGLSERIYSTALAHELRDRGHSVVRELLIEVRYKGRGVAKQRLDLVVDDRVIVENKASEKLCPADRIQIVSYLRASKFEVGLLLHFGPSARFERFIDYPKRELDMRFGTQ